MPPKNVYDDILKYYGQSTGEYIPVNEWTTTSTTYNYTALQNTPPKYIDDGAYDIVNCMNSTKMTAKEKSQTVIKKILVNGPATVVFWGDGSKTIVKANGEDFDAEKALAMAFVKRMCGNKGSYIDILHRAMKENDLDWEVGNSEGDK